MTPWNPNQRNRTLAVLLLVGIGVVLALFGLRRAPYGLTIDVGNEPPFVIPGNTETFSNFFLFYEPEQADNRSFRWMSERGTVTIPAALQAQPLVVEIVACRCRPAETVPVELLLNNREIATLQAADQWRQYRVLVPPDLTHPEQGIMVEMWAPTWQDSSGRALGLAVDRISVRQIVSPPLADPPGAVLVLLCSGLLLWRRCWPLLPLPLLLLAAWCLVNALYEPWFLSRGLVSLVLVAGLTLLWLVDRAPSGEAWRSLVYAPLAVWLVLSPQLLGHWIIDDAYISFRYARHLVEGHGLVFNVGERVEGYTNFLWTLLVAGAMALGGDPVVLAVLVPFALAFVLLALTIVLARRIVPQRWVWAAPALLAVSNPFLLYTTRGSGMETALFAILTTAALVALLDHRWLLAGLLAALTLLTRPDGVLLAAVGPGYALVVGLRSKRHEGAAGGHWRRRLYPAARYLLPLLVLFVPYYLWRWSYYGYPLPNTFYVKVGATQAQFWLGLQYLWQFARADLLLPVAAGGVLSAVIAWWRGKRSEPLPWHAIGISGALTGLVCLYVVFVGGDWMPGARFFLPVLPLLAVLCAWSTAYWSGRLTAGGPMPALTVLVALAALLAAGLPRNDSADPDSPVWRENTVVARHREIGRWLHANTPPDTLLAAAVAGALPYYAERPTIDMLGLNDEHIAHLPSEELGTGVPGHEKTDVDYVLRRRPDIVPYKGTSLLWERPAFKQAYQMHQFHGPEGQAVWLYIRRDAHLPGLPQGINPPGE